MEQIKLIDAGVFLFKRKKSIIAIAVAVAILMVIFCCFTGPNKEEALTLKLTADPSLDTFISQNTDNSTLILSGEEIYPFDDKVTEYVEKIKLSKKQSGRVNPYLSHNRLSVENIQSSLSEGRFIEFLKEKGVDAKIEVSVSASDVKINIEYDSGKKGDTYSNDVIGYVSEYLSTVMDEYVKDVLDTHKKLIVEDEKLINQLITEYNEATKTAGTDPLALEKCRALLSSYAQVAYNYDVSNTVVMLSNQLLAIDISHNVELIDFDMHDSTSFGVITVFSVFGLLVGLICGCFAIYVISLCGQVFKKVQAKNENKNEKEEI